MSERGARDAADGGRRVEAVHDRVGVEAGRIRRRAKVPGGRSYRLWGCTQVLFKLNFTQNARHLPRPRPDILLHSGELLRAPSPPSPRPPLYPRTPVNLFPCLRFRF